MGSCRKDLDPPFIILRRKNLMNQNAKMALVIGGIVSAVAGLTTLGVVYARFELAQKTVKQTTLGDLLREKELKTQHEDDTAADAEDTEGPDEVIVETPVGPQAETEEAKIPDLTVAKPKAKSTKKGAQKE